MLEPERRQHTDRALISADYKSTVVYVMQPGEPRPVINATRQSVVVVFESCEPGIAEAVEAALASLTP